MPGKLALRITRTTQPGPRVADPDLGFGQVFTDHMLVMEYAQGTGWHDARIEPYGPLTLDPATPGPALRAGGLRRAQGVPIQRG